MKAIIKVNSPISSIEYLIVKTICMNFLETHIYDLWDSSLQNRFEYMLKHYTTFPVELTDFDIDKGVGHILINNKTEITFSINHTSI